MNGLRGIVTQNVSQAAITQLQIDVADLLLDVAALAALGYIGQADANDAVAVTTIRDLTGLAVTFTAVAGARYEISWVTNWLQQVAGVGICNVGVYNAANTALQLIGSSNAVNNYFVLGGVVTNVPGAGSCTFKLRAAVTVGQVAMNGNSVILVKRIA